MIPRCWLILFVVLCGHARAAEIVFHDITWPSHDKATGMLEWELRARTAHRAIAKNQYECVSPELRTYRLVEENGRSLSKEDLYLRADSGTYIRGDNESTANLVGRVVTELYSDERVQVTTDDADVKSTWDGKKKIRTREIKTDSKVSAVSETRTLTGFGMTVFQQAGPKGAADKSMWTIQRNVVMTIEGGTGPLPSIPGTGPAEPRQPEPTTIYCLGPLVIDRLANRAVFHNRVTLSSAGTLLKCDKLTLAFKHVKVDGKAETRLQSLLAVGQVVVTGKDQRFAGDRFDWDPAKAVGRLTGKPAKMTAPGTAATAETIEFDQQTQLIKYRGNGEVRIDLKTE